MYVSIYITYHYLDFPEKTVLGEWTSATEKKQFSGEIYVENQHECSTDELSLIQIISNKVLVIN